MSRNNNYQLNTQLDNKMPQSTSIRQDEELEIIEINPDEILKEQKITQLEKNSNEPELETIILSDEENSESLPSENIPPRTRRLPFPQLTLRTNFNEPPTQFFYQREDINPNDIQQLKYEYQKELSHRSISKDEKFMVRMEYDVFKRQSIKNEIDQMIEKNKKRHGEERRMKGFNRLIEDANRRIEAKDTIEKKKRQLFAQQSFKLKGKRYKNDEWGNIYRERFVKYCNEKNKKLIERIEEQKELRIKEEDEVIKECKVRKAPLKDIQINTQRMFEEAKKKQERLKELMTQQKKNRTNKKMLEHQRKVIHFKIKGDINRKRTKSIGM